MKAPPRLSLARLPTPIQRLKNTSLELKKDVYIWRDDLSGFNDSGNKIRKLEFLVADALSQGADTLVTCGGPQSNHTRATAAVARQLGLGISILIAPRAGFDREKAPTGNLLLNRIFDAKLTWIDPERFKERGGVYDIFLEEEAERLRSEGKKPYLIPLGGSNALGCYAYRRAISEMLKTWKDLHLGTSSPTSIFCAMGSGATYLGLQLGLQDHRLDRTRLAAINVTGSSEVGQAYIERLQHDLEQNGMKLVHPNSSLIDGYLGEGYSIASDADLAFYVKVAREEGVVLDPCYTGKAFQGMIGEIKSQPSFYGDKVLFLHSGGGFSNFAYAEQFQKVMTEASFA